MDYRVDLPEFHGPLDLLLYLVKKHEVDVRDIPIATIAEQFRQYLDILQVADIELAGDFLVMAATLMEIKSRMLLPQAETEAAEDEADPRKELVRQLVEYKKFKEAAARLETRAAEQQRRLPRQAVAQPAAPSGPPAVQAVELWDLVSAFGRLLSETKALEPTAVVEDETPQQVYQDLVRDRLRAEARVRFRDLFSPPFYRARLVGLFLAVLELIRRFEAVLEQDGLFGEIWLSPLNVDH
ncbi:MAG TPA: segregation/condensation protein A [Gemmataceae bacterium]|nr:segregation/condensation protein A [Gemmataceae bacterium]